jgi:hypothetical protein
MGGTIVQQLASSAAMQAADAMVEKIDPSPTSTNRQGNDLLGSGGRDITQEILFDGKVTFPDLPQPTPRDPLAGLLPAPEIAEQPPEPPPPPAISTTAEAATTPLATVEIWGLVVGNEKEAMLKNLSQLGIGMLPPRNVWDQWQLVEGGIPQADRRPLLILVPPELGKLRSGDKAVIETSSANGIYLARDRLDP